MKKYLKIAPEGYKIIFYTSILCFSTYLLSLFFEYSWIQLLNIYSFYLLIGICYFFRDPLRKNINSDNCFLSPADGKVIGIDNCIDSDLGDAKKISIFLSVFNVHRQWIPKDALVLDSVYNPGKFFGAFRNKASEKNEQTSVLFRDTNENLFKVKQIAGFVARRIVNYMDINLNVNQGQNLGFIKFGSRVEIIVPNNFEIKIEKGMKVKGCKTIIGNFRN
tara:strand:+ start:183 stop:842 length:660 start_codon:yes stop_codon:yes gene_type:complete